MSTRNRFRRRQGFEIVPYQLVHRNPDGSVFSTLHWGDFPNCSYDEIFYDQFEAPKRGYAYPDHPCRHERIRGNTNPIGQWPSGTLTGGFEPDRKWSITSADLMGCIPTIPPEVLDDIAWAAMESYITDIKEEASLLNFLIELKDFGFLLGSLGGFIQRLLIFFSKPGLSWEFAIKPFLEDLVKFYGALEKVKRKIEFLRKFDGKETTLNYTAKKVEERFGWAPVVPSPGDYPGTPGSLCWCTDLEIIVKCHARVQIRCKHLDNQARILDAYMKAFGLASIFQWLRAGYRAIPFSWLFDFFFKTNRFWAKFNTSVFGEYGRPPIEVLSTTHSIRTKAKIKVRGRTPDTVIHDAGNYLYQSFSRSSGLPFSGDGSILRIHTLTDNVKMLAILLQILLPGINWKRFF